MRKAGAMKWSSVSFVYTIEYTYGIKTYDLDDWNDYVEFGVAV
jgi:hypothetical protein